MATERCPKCKGSKKQECGHCGNVQERRLGCPECHGTGELKCATCDGKGWVQSTSSQPRP